MILWAYRNWGNVPIMIEAPLIEGMKRLLARSEWLRDQESDQGMRDQLELLLNRNDWIVPASQAERESLLQKHGASLWFVTDGMMQSNLAQWYYRQMSGDTRNLVLLTEPCFPGVLWTSPPSTSGLVRCLLCHENQV